MFRYVVSRLFKKLSIPAIRNSHFGVDSKVESGTTFISSSMGSYSFCGYDCEIINTDIGSFCSIANGVVIGGTMHPLDWVSTSPVFYDNKDSVKTKFSRYERPLQKRTVIGSDVWIGRNAILKQGITIGTGAVIGMGAVVTKSVPPFAIVVGNPAAIIKYRFDEQTIIRLLRSEWWNLDSKTLKALGVHSRNPDLFLSALDKTNG